MTPEMAIEELAARIQLAQGSPTLLLALAESDATLDETRRILIEILRAAVEAPDIGSTGRMLATAIAAVSAGPEDTKIAVEDTASLEALLMKAGRGFLRAATDLRARRGEREVEGRLLLGAALQKLTNAKVQLERSFPGWRSTAARDSLALIGADTPGGRPLAIIEVDSFSVRASGVSPRAFERHVAVQLGSAQLDQYLARASAPLGALVLLNSLPPDATEPHIEHAKTPAGRDVLIVDL